MITKRVGAVLKRFKRDLVRSPLDFKEGWSSLQENSKRVEQPPKKFKVG